MTRFDEVTRLRELGKRLVALKKRRQDWNSVNYGIMEEISIEQSLHNATPWLLEAAACFQPGDADLLHWMRTAEGDAGDGTLEEVHDAIESLLIRMEKAAEIMDD